MRFSEYIGYQRCLCYFLQQATVGLRTRVYTTIANLLNSPYIFQAHHLRFTSRQSAKSRLEQWLWALTACHIHGHPCKTWYLYQVSVCFHQNDNLALH